jgi:hypothetical protein
MASSLACLAKEDGMRRTLCLVLVLACGVALAQAPLTTFDGGAFGYRLGYPSGWVVEQEDGGSYLNIQPPPGTPESGRVAIELLADTEWMGTLEEGVEGVLSELRANLLPDLAVQSRTPATVSGVPAVVVRLSGSVDGAQPVTYRLLLTLQGRTGYVLFLEALTSDFAAFEPLFEQVQSSFVLTQTQAAPSPPVSPLAPPAPVSPLAPATPAHGTPAYAGAFADDQLRLVLEAPGIPGGAYVGTLHHGDQRYPVRAQLEPQGLVGDFESGGSRFAFTATLAGDELTFVTDGNRYVLVRETATPVAPVNPIGATPVAPAEVVASETGTADIGAVPPNGRARGRLDGVADDLSFHAYYVDVPAGSTRLTIVLDADADLDIAVKFGSPTDRFSDKDRGGDWDYRDVGTQNPTTLVIDQPAAGRWFVDVLNVLGAGQNGNYVLGFATEGGGAAPAPGPAPVPAPEVVASETGTAFIGALPANGRARGRLDGTAEQVTFHTYVVEVPAGTARLTLVLDADVDLDIAVKGGSEIRSYANKDQGGDWDYRDLDTMNPTTVVVEAPAAGPWYVDVMNALGGGRNGSYTLTVSTSGGF